MWRNGLRSTALAIAVLASLSAAAQDVNETAAWERIRVSGSADQLRAFLDMYPKGQFAPEARQKYSLVANTMLPPEVRDMDVRFPSDAIRLGRSLGALRVVKLNIQVQQDGKARDVDVVKSSGFNQYDSAAVQAARNATYLPAVERGMAVDSRLDYDVSFGLLCNRAAGASPDCDRGRFPQECSATVCALLRR